MTALYPDSMSAPGTQARLVRDPTPAQQAAVRRVIARKFAMGMPREDAYLLLDVLGLLPTPNSELNVAPEPLSAPKPPPAIGSPAPDPPKPPTAPPEPRTAPPAVNNRYRPGHPSGEGCTCREDCADVVDFECVGVWTLTDDGYRPLNNPTQHGIWLAQIGHHRRADADDYGATEGALRGSFLPPDGAPVDTIRYPDRPPKEARR